MTEHIPASDIKPGDKVNGQTILRVEQSAWGEARIYGYIDVGEEVEGSLPLSWYDDQYVMVERKPFDRLGFVMAVEGGEISSVDYLTGMSHMVKSGDAFRLQGSWGRAAAALIESGCLTPDGDITEFGRDEAESFEE